MDAWRQLGRAVGAVPAQSEAPTTPFGEVDGPGGRPALPALGPQDPLVLQIGLTRLRAHDPGFDQAAFTAAAAQAFLAVEQAWTHLDPQLSRRYMSLPLWSSHRARMELYQLHGRRNVLDGLAVRHAAIVAVERDSDADGGRERVTVRIDARSTDYDVDASRQVVRGTTAPGDWAEDWVFERNAAAVTPGGGGVLAQRCPNCRAPLELDDQGQCTSCHAPVMDGTRDWVVVAVQRPEQEARMLEAVLGVRHAPPDPRDPTAPTFEAVPVALPLPSAPPSPVHDTAALAVLTAADPAFVPEDLCRHAAAAFCALRNAWAALDTAAVRPYLNDGAEHELATDMQALRDRGLRRLADDPLVIGTVIVHADDADGLVTVGVAVQAELIDADVDGSGTLIRGDRLLQDIEQRLTFRRHSRAGSPSAGVVVLRCSRCGAPLRAAGIEHCEYCHQAIADGGGEWALIDIGPMTPHVLHSIQPEAPPPPAATADGGVVAAITARFPGFNDHEFLALARESFYAVESATTHLDPTLSAGHVSDAFAAEQTARLQQLRSEHHHVVLAFLDLAGARITARSDDGAVVVRFDISAQDEEHDDLTGAIVAGTPAVHTWPERWTFEPSPTGRPWRVSAVSLIVG